MSKAKGPGAGARIFIDYKGCDPLTGVPTYAWHDRTNGDKPKILTRDQVAHSLNTDYRAATLVFGDRINESQRARFKKAQTYHVRQ